MKSITLSLPDDLLQKGRAYAREHGTTLNSLVGQLLREKVERDAQIVLTTLFREMDKVTLTRSAELKRKDLYER